MRPWSRTGDAGADRLRVRGKKRPPAKKLMEKWIFSGESGQRQPFYRPLNPRVLSTTPPLRTMRAAVRRRHVVVGDEEGGSGAMDPAGGKKKTDADEEGN